MKLLTFHKSILISCPKVNVNHWCATVFIPANTPAGSISEFAQMNVVHNYIPSQSEGERSAGIVGVGDIYLALQVPIPCRNN